MQLFLDAARVLTQISTYTHTHIHTHTHTHTHLSIQLCREDGKIELLTKGDNNRVGDRGLYAPGQLWLNREDILGRAAGYVYLSAGKCVGGNMQAALAFLLEWTSTHSFVIWVFSAG